MENTKNKNIASEMVHLLYSQAKPAVAGSLVVASFLLYSLHGTVPENILLMWYGLMVTVNVTRYVLIKIYLSKPRPVETSSLWLNIFIVMAFIAGVTWSMAGTVIISYSQAYQTFIVCSLAGVAAGAIPYFSGSRTACFAFFVPVLLPFAVWASLQPSLADHLLGLLTLLYATLLAISCFRTNAAVYSAIKLKFENLQLVKDLTQAQTAMKDINSDLQVEIVERKHAEKLLRESEEQYRLITDAMPVLIAYIDHNFKFKYVNKAHEEWFGKSVENILNKSAEDILGSPTCATFKSYIEKLNGEKSVNFETLLKIQKEERFVSTTLIPHLKDNVAQGFFSLISDMSPRINYLATHDALTGLPNRRLFSARFLQTIDKAKHSTNHVAMMFLDLDHFKKINDTLGHDVGDQLLIQAVDRITTCLRPEDTLARFGGDEFIILLENITPSQIHTIANSICQKFTTPFHVYGREVFTTSSIGVSLFPDDGKDMNGLLKNADMALYRAKESGRNTFQFYTLEMNDKLRKKIELENHLRNALERNELTLHYQPVMDVALNTVKSLEALIRWNHPSFGLVLPSEFIPLAEEVGLIIPLGEWVLRNVCKQSLAWQQEGRISENFRIAINLSAYQFRQQNLVETITEILETTGVKGSSITLEITETLIMQDLEFSTKVMAELKKLGIIFALDDFGTGYSSLSYLRRFPIDVLKIDRSFITDLNTKTEDSGNIIKAIIALAHSLSLRVTAEGVETWDQYEFLKQVECDEIQGYLLSKPIAVDEIAKFLANNFSVEEYLKSSYTERLHSE